MHSRRAPCYGLKIIVDPAAIPMHIRLKYVIQSANIFSILVQKTWFYISASTNRLFCIQHSEFKMNETETHNLENGEISKY